MTDLLAWQASVIVAYLVGGIPFAYLFVKARKGIDIRTIGSGNVGATNAGRILGFRYFLLIFGLDVLKGLLPTLAIPRLAESLVGHPLPGLPVFVALATILGHNFPYALGFRGGKGVATSLGALAALDPASAGSAFVVFVVCLLVTKFVSLSSVAGGLAFAGVHFASTPEPGSRSQLPMTLVTLGLLVMLIVRHRKNFARIAAGTEPKVQLRRNRSEPTSTRAGKAYGWILLAIVLLASGGYTLATRLRAPSVINAGPLTIQQLDRVGTGHQRADDVVFADDGRVIAVACPRYQRVVFYRVSPERKLTLLRDVEVDGRPIALAATRTRILVLQRPHGDARHVEEGYWEAFNFDAHRVGSKHRIGWDPDDLVPTPDGRHLVIVRSGHAEGEENRPKPSLLVQRLSTDDSPPTNLAELTFEKPGDDPHRITISRSGIAACLLLRGKSHDVLASIDLSDPAQPRLLSRAPAPDHGAPFVSTNPDDKADSLLVPTDPERDAGVWPGASPESLLVFATLPEGSGLEVVDASGHRTIATIPLRAAAGFGEVRPTAVDVAPNQGLVAVSTRAGGVHLLEARSNSAPPQVATTPTTAPVQR